MAKVGSGRLFNTLHHICIIEELYLTNSDLRKSGDKLKIVTKFYEDQMINVSSFTLKPKIR